MRKKTKFSDTLDFKCDNEWPKGEPKENWHRERRSLGHERAGGDTLGATTFRVEHRPGCRAHRKAALKARSHALPSHPTRGVLRGKESKIAFDSS